MYVFQIKNNQNKCINDKKNAGCNLVNPENNVLKANVISVNNDPSRKLSASRITLVI